ncbi:HAMP domain-containing sensor histidine kinase [Streptomyces sp. Ag109_G2-15]|uniref:sensor histidine kinase n=1 Tax=Streptomyces sp. Ag109_G2-15 TaxID=1938850 RepID=UPI000BD4DE05|nr:HAMP domain-containing sensor histidine kinase [Streptomyces sp. Ag109_G2-15]SOD85329.1 two-component system, OmpR family, sensor kinase [Streptomyces sp. Ag109_G2-15]
MSGRRRPRPQKRRAGQPRTLRTRLVVASVVLIAVVCAVIGTVTTLALRTHLYDQLDGKVGEIGMRAAGGRLPGGTGPGALPVPDSDSKNSSTPSERIEHLLTNGPTQPNTVAAFVQNGSIASAGKAVQLNDSYNRFRKMDRVDLTAAQQRALAKVSKDGKPHTVELPGLGDYRVQYKVSPDGSGDAYYVALPTKDVDDNIDTLIVVEVCVTVAGLLAASLAGFVIVGVATRPLRKVAATATRVSELPLHTGEVNLSERVPESETDPHTEVGQVGAALNRMLDHVHGALHARQQSETRVRQFVADASHELRTPLASIRGYAELTRRGREQVGPDTRHALGRIESEAGRMTLLVEDLLLLARLDAGRPLQFEQTDLIPLVVDTISDARAAGMDHNWRLDLPDEPALVSADAARLQQVLVNLLGNARNHTPPGTTVTARVQRRGPWMCIDVEDNGQGIPADLLPHVFERFARGDSARSRATGSTGLGLAIVQAVAAAHGGAVTVDSVPGRTVFTVHLPALAPQPQPEMSWQQHSQAQHSATTWVQQGA